MGPRTRLYIAARNTLLPFSDLLISKELWCLDGATAPYNLSQSVKLVALPCGEYLCSSGILTGFPFVYVGLRIHLGSTNSRLKNIAEKPLPFRRSGFSPNFAVTTGRIFIPKGSTRRYRRASAPSGCLLTTSADALVQGIGDWLEPRPSSLPLT